MCRPTARAAVLAQYKHPRAARERLAEVAPPPPPAAGYRIALLYPPTHAPEGT